MFLGDGIPQLQQLFALELDELLALAAVQMIVLGITVVVLKNATTIELELAEQSGIDKFVERPVDGGPTDVSFRSLIGESFDERIGVEVIMLTENMIDK